MQIAKSHLFIWERWTHLTIAQIIVDIRQVRERGYSKTGYLTVSYSTQMNYQSVLVLVMVKIEIQNYACWYNTPFGKSGHICKLLS